MAKSQVSLNADEFLKNLSIQQKRYLKTIMGNVSKSLDSIRMRAADKYIISRTAGFISGKFSMSRLYKLQPTDKYRLTERTGRLKKILKSPGSWKTTFKQSRLQADPHLLFWIKPQSSGSSSSFLIRLSVTEKGDKGVGFRIKNETKGDKKGVIRKFLEPAIHDEKDNLSKNIQIALNELLMV